MFDCFLTAEFTGPDMDAKDIKLPAFSAGERVWEKAMDDLFKSMKQGGSVVLPSLNGHTIRTEFFAFKLLGLRMKAERLGAVVLLKE